MINKEKEKNKFEKNGLLRKKIKERKIKNRGVEKYKILFLINGLIVILENNFIASENGWKIPINPTLDGPIRNWITPKIFRSKIVKNSTLNNIKTK